MNTPMGMALAHQLDVARRHMEVTVWCALPSDEQLRHARLVEHWMRRRDVYGELHAPPPDFMLAWQRDQEQGRAVLGDRNADYKRRPCAKASVQAKSRKRRCDADRDYSGAVRPNNGQVQVPTHAAVSVWDEQVDPTEFRDITERNVASIVSALRCRTPRSIAWDPHATYCCESNWSDSDSDSDTRPAGHKRSVKAKSAHRRLDSSEAVEYTEQERAVWHRRKIGHESNAAIAAAIGTSVRAVEQIMLDIRRQRAAGRRQPAKSENRPMTKTVTFATSVTCNDGAPS